MLWIFCILFFFLIIMLTFFFFLSFYIYFNNRILNSVGNWNWNSFRQWLETKNSVFLYNYWNITYDDVCCVFVITLTLSYWFKHFKDLVTGTTYSCMLFNSQTLQNVQICVIETRMILKGIKEIYVTTMLMDIWVHYDSVILIKLKNILASKSSHLSTHQYIVLNDS